MAAPGNRREARRFPATIRIGTNNAYRNFSDDARASVGAVVATSSLTVVAPAPGETVAGWKMHRDSEGNEEHDNVTPLLNDPPPGERTSEKIAVPPAGMVCVSASLVIEKFTAEFSVTGVEC